MKALEVVIDPELHRSIVELDMVRSIEVGRQRGGRRDRLADDARLPDQGPLPDRRRRGRRGARGGDPRERLLRRPQRLRRRRRCSRSSDAAACPPGALAQVANVLCIGSGKGGVGKSTLTANLAAALTRRRQARGGPRRRRVGLLDPAHVRARRDPPAGVGRAQDHSAGGPRREGDVDRLLRRGGRRRRVARADAPQGPHPVPPGRRLGRARLPARRPSARHRRRLDDARPAAPPGAAS